MTHQLLKFVTDKPIGALGEDSASHTFLGLDMYQNQNALLVFDTILKHYANNGIKVGQIIEIGTALGGLSVFLGLAAKAYFARFITYDVRDYTPYKDFFSRLLVDFRIGNCFTEEHIIKNEIQAEGATILFCDGGNKASELNTFAKHLKPGDVVLAHDYGYDRESFEKDVRYKWWEVMELSYVDIKQTVEGLPLEPFIQDLATMAGMCCFKKK